MEDLTGPEMAMLVDLLGNWTGPTDDAINMITKKAEQDGITLKEYIIVERAKSLLKDEPRVQSRYFR